jgi:hypothetical protein
VEPERSQDDMALEQLGPLGIPDSPGRGAHDPQVEGNTPTIRL